MVDRTPMVLEKDCSHFLRWMSGFTGSKALQTAEAGCFDAYIIDVRLPEVDDLIVQERLQQTDPEAGILMLSGEATLEDVVDSLDKGADAFILKPIDPDDIVIKL